MQPFATAQQQTSSVPTQVESTIGRIERIIAWIGSPASLAIHTIAFIAFFAASIFGLVNWDLMLLVLTTIVSLEAIYLAIFIQMSVNRQSISLREVEEDVGDIQEDIEELGENVEELGENVEDLKEDVEDIQEDIGEISEDLKEDGGEVSADAAQMSEAELRETKQAEMLEALTNDVRAILRSLESMKR
jgi:peptidoglycan hydrolase CwlO-like protein